MDGVLCCFAVVSKYERIAGHAHFLEKHQHSDTMRNWHAPQNRADSGGRNQARVLADVWAAITERKQRKKEEWVCRPTRQSQRKNNAENPTDRKRPARLAAQDKNSKGLGERIDRGRNVPPKTRRGRSQLPNRAKGKQGRQQKPEQSRPDKVK